MPSQPLTISSLRELKGRAALRIWLPAVLMIGIVWTVVAAFVAHERQQIDVERSKLAVATAKGLSEFAALKIKDADLGLARLRADYLRTGDLPKHAAIVSEFGHGAASLAQVIVTNAGGDIVRSSVPTPMTQSATMAQRPEFLSLRSDPVDRLRLTQPGGSLTPRSMPLELMRPLRGASGEFLGVIVGRIAPVELPRYFDSIGGFDAGGAVSIVSREDGLTHARFTKGSVTWGESINGSELWPALSTDISGIQELTGGAAGQGTIVAFHQVGDYPLVVVVSNAVAGWRAISLGTLVVVLALALGLSAATVYQTVLKAKASAQPKQVIEREGQVIGQLALAAESQKELEQIKLELLNGVSHELGTPLNAILGFSALIHADTTDTHIHQYAQQIHSEGIYLQSVVDTLLDLAKSDVAAMEIRRTPVDLVPLITTLFKVHAINAGRKGLAMVFQLDLAPHLQAQAHTDKALVRHALNIVLSNMVKFTNALSSTGQRSILVTVAVLAGALSIRVRHASLAGGVQLPSKPSAQASEPVDNRAGSEACTAAFSLAGELMTRLGGTVMLTSSKGGGNEVEISLPGVQIVMG
jgi:signal transduction histidine kinase